MARTNKYPAPCAECGSRVPKNGGALVKEGRAWVVRHLACAEAGAPRVVSATFNSGETVFVNSRGRCIDAPCCGCCS